MSFVDTIKKHVMATVSISVLAIAAIVAGASFGAYTAKYNKEAEEVASQREALEAKLPKAPKDSFIDNGYFTYDDTAKTVTASKSAYKGSYVYEADAAEVILNDKAAPTSLVDVEGTAWKAITGLGKKGGTISFTITTTSYGLSDIDVVLASAWKNKAGEMQTVSNISDYIKIEVNGLLVQTKECELPESGEYQHLILKDTHLMEGVNTLNIKTAVYNTLGGNDLYVMPNVRNIAVMTNAGVTANAAAE